MNRPDGHDVHSSGANTAAARELDFIVRWRAAWWLDLDTGSAHLFDRDDLSDTGVLFYR